MLGIASSLVLCMRRDYALVGAFTAKLSVVVHYLPHQVFDDLLADDPILLARQFCDYEALLHGTTVSRYPMPRLNA